MNLFSLLASDIFISNPIGRDILDNGLIVSTVDTSDMGPETAIIDKNGAHPVERYETVELAEEGHAKWLEFCDQMSDGFGEGFCDFSFYEEDSGKFKKVTSSAPEGTKVYFVNSITEF